MPHVGALWGKWIMRNPILHADSLRMFWDSALFVSAGYALPVSAGKDKRMVQKKQNYVNIISVDFVD